MVRKIRIHNFDHDVDARTPAGTKYFGGHSDLLCGVLVVKSSEEWAKVGVSVSSRFFVSFIVE